MLENPPVGFFTYVESVSTGSDEPASSIQHLWVGGSTISGKIPWVLLE
jgi:hypothetical protein